MSLAVQILAALDTLAREERERAELGARLMAEVQVDPDEIVLLPREATPSTASAASPRSAPVGSEEPPGYALEDLEALVKMLLSMFESGEFLRFLRFSSDFSQAVTALAQHALIDPRDRAGDAEPGQRGGGGRTPPVSCP